MQKFSMKLISKGHFCGKNRKGEMIDLIKGVDGIWYAYKNGNRPAISIFRGDDPLFTVISVLA